MKKKKLMAACLAGALVISSVIVPGQASVKAKGKSLTEGLVASYDFNDGKITNSVSGQGQAKVVVTGLGDYNGQPVFEAGDQDKGQAIRLGDYGLKLNQKDLGDNFTVSMWLKPDGIFVKNEAVMFLGYHSPEKWLAVAGPEDANGSATCKFWSNGSGNDQSVGWKGFGNFDIDTNWHCLTITGSNDGVTAYLDGKAVGEGVSIAPLTGENQDVYIGVNNWDSEFKGLVDDVKVYDRKLTEQEVIKLYDPAITPEDVLEQEGITATKDIHTIKGRTEQITVNIPAVAVEAGAKATYASKDLEVAAVAGNGAVTAKKAGDTTITTTVTLGKITKTAETKVHVEESVESQLKATFDFEGNLTNGVASAEDSAKEASAIVTGLKAYNGEVAYQEGRTGKAVRLGDYGLKLNQENLGKDYTVSAWVYADAGLMANQVMMFLGHHNPENWIAISGRAYESDKCKVWAKGGIYGSHTTLFNPEIGRKEWHQITMTGTEGKFNFYLDGICLGTADSNNPLSGKNQDIYLGVNNWDPEYEGLMDDVKIYSVAMTEEEVQNQAAEDFSKKAQEILKKELTVKDILGQNKSADEIYYNLELPKEVAGMKLDWTSSKEDVIAVDGTLTVPSKDTEVTLTAKIAGGVLEGEVSFKVTVKALDVTKLKELIQEAKAMDQSGLSENSKKRLNESITAAEEAVKNPTYEGIETAYENLKRAMEDLSYAHVENPFDLITEVAAKATLKEGETQELFVLPEAVKDLVTVTYESEDDKVVTYTDGSVVAVGEGKAVVTAIVTANEDVLGYGGFPMEYSTAVEVTKDAPPAHIHDMEKTNPKEPTCTTEGNVEYWYCKECGKYFSDAEGKTEIRKEDTVLPMTEHEWEDDYTIDKEATETEDGSKSIHCKNCTAKKDIQVIPATGDGQTGGNTGNTGGNKPGSGTSGAAGSVKTGDSANWMLWTVLIGPSLAGCVLVVRRKKTSR